MAIRLRKIDGTMVALCAAKSKSQAFDRYLDDGLDHALRIKFLKDFESEGLLVDPPLDEKVARIMQAAEEDR